MDIDNTDTAILGLLKINARLPISHIATKVGISRASAKKRIERMETLGIITGYTVYTRLAASNKVRAWVHIRVEGNKISNVTYALSLEIATQKVYSTNGKWDLLVELEADNLSTFDQTLDRIRSIAGVASSETSILLSTYKS